MAEDLNYAKIYLWVCIKYMHNCHESGELQGFDEIIDNNVNIKLILLCLSFVKALCD
jgi:hypothetical protein